MLKNTDEEIQKHLNENLLKLPDGCWGWKGYKDGFSTPTVRISGAYIAVLKITFWNAKGYKPLWKHMTQLCHYPKCLNPDHYTDRTPQRDRRPWIVKVVTQNTKCFTEAEEGTLWERKLFGEKLKDLAEEYRVNWKTVSRAIARHRKFLQ